MIVERIGIFFRDSFSLWSSGGWLMLPLLLLAVIIYYAVLELLFYLKTHFMIRNQVYKMSDSQVACLLNDKSSPFKELLYEDATNVRAIKHHFAGVRNEHLSVINGRIRFLSVLITTGPLFGLLGTVIGMFSIFAGMSAGLGNPFDSIVKGISEALITTQTGLIISIPAYVILSFIIQRRNTLERCIERLECYNKSLIITR